MAYEIELRRDTAANWTSVNPVLASGEPGYETDTKKLKIGDGTTGWNSLTYFGGSGTGLPSIITRDTPEAHGAVRDGVTDDTAAINAAINSVITTAQANGTNYGEVWFSAGIYKINGALIQGGTTYGNAQIPLPLINTTVAGRQKFTLVFVMPDTGAAVEHWTQTVAQKGGTILDSNLQSAYSATYGSPAVIGGPTTEQGVEFSAGAVSRGSNMMFKVKGTLQINMSNPVVTGTTSSTPHCNALDLQQVGECDIEGFRADNSIVWGTTLPPDSGGGCGIRMPQAGNNDNCRVGTVSVQGVSNGIVTGEHTIIERACAVFCYRGVQVGGVTPDSCSIVSLSTEACAQHVSADGVTRSGTQSACISIVDWSIEDETNLTTVAHVYDPGNMLRGDVVSAYRNKTSSGAAPDSIAVPGAWYQPIIKNGGKGFEVNDRRHVKQQTLVVSPEDFGAMRDGTTDDTTAIKNAISFAVQQGIANGTYYGEVHFSDGTYAVKGALDTTQSGSAQIPLPIVSTAGPKFTLVLKARSSGSAGYHWNQTQSQPCTIFSSTVTGTGQDSVIGGPGNAWTDPNGSSGGNYSNMQLVLDGFALGATHDAGLIGIDARHIAEFNFINGLSILTERWPTGRTGGLANTNSIGVYFPVLGNNDNCGGDNLVIFDWYYGFAFADHTTIERVKTIYCVICAYMQSQAGGYTHGAYFEYWSAEGYGNCILQSANANRFPITIGRIDAEVSGGTYDIIDTTNTLSGEIGWAYNTGRGPLVNGGANLVFIDHNAVRGAMAVPPSVPASGTASTPVYRNCAVTVSGTGLTGVNVDGVNMVLVPGTYIVPSGKLITLTYTGTVVWNWIVL